MIEIEIKAHIEDFESIKGRLNLLGAEFIGTENQVDAVFGHPKFLDENKKVVEGGFSARVRQNNDKRSVDFKEIKRNGIGMELSAPVSGIEAGREFLEKLGFEEAFTVVKKRENYKYKDLIISFDDVEKLGKFIEVEHNLHQNEGADKAIKECEDLLERIAPEAVIENQKYGDLVQELINKGTDGS